ncbi:uncharacterized protein LOC121517941 isoform X2 [Cheilinus undulatus]|uniref:uncharacterized protein LOC121517941 isoform X2 n=1 Tax=Cheilinus undulatus TaxID=241271 RepID=UPI001BD435A9|nr:uncharacterized protein LOC121517941 isoform X2 [Cheilinus undulatus]
MSLDSLEGAIHNLLSVLYPPFEATAPTLLNQLFLIIESHFQGDALQCLLDFLVPAKRILETVQQAACAPYFDALFLYEGWPLCLNDQVVVQLAPIDPLQLQPGDFYLQVAPFCDQSARIVVCSLLEEEGLISEVVEETPIPGTSYPCIFSHDWLGELNQGRQGTPLSQCLLPSGKGVVRLPWERVAMPDFVNAPLCGGNSMASASPSHPPLAHPPCFDSSISNLSLPHSPLKDSAPKHYPTTIKHPLLPSSSHPFSVETRICPAKHGIAVSLCLVDSSWTASSSKLAVQETETKPKPIDSMSPNTWGRCLTERDPNKVTKASNGICSPASADINSCKSEGIEQETNKETNIKDIDRSGPVGQVAAEGEYIDILQATMLFSNAQTMKGEKQKSEMQMQSNAQIQPLTQRYPYGCTQIQPQIQTHSNRQTGKQPNTQITSPTQSQAHMTFPTESQVQSQCRSETAESLSPNMSIEDKCPSAVHNSQLDHPRLDTLDSSQCMRAVQFLEKPCTPCMRRRQGGRVSRAQELRCRYRDSYQAAIENPVAFGQGKESRDDSAVTGEDVELCHKTQRLLETETGKPWFNVQGMWDGPEMKPWFASSVSEVICKESGEINTVPCWTPGYSDTTTWTDYRDSNVLKNGDMPKQIPKRTALPSRESRNIQSSKSCGNFSNVNGTNLAARALSSSYDQQRHVMSDKIHIQPTSPGQISGSDINGRLHERLQSINNSRAVSAGFLKTRSVSENRKSLSDGRCSSLSTAVVDTSEKCELVIVEGEKVRRKEITDSFADIPQLHVVKCKHSTAFRLVSPKINRRNKVIADDAQQGCMTITSRNSHQTEKLSQTNSCLTTEKPRTTKPASATPRPDNLFLGIPDPSPHPFYLGVASLTGARDRTGRAIVELYGDHQGWRSAQSHELLKMLLYFHSITRREIREAGLTLIFNARKTNPQPQLYKALMALQEQTPQAINSFVVLVDKDSSPQPERCAGIQTEVVMSVKALFKLVEVSQLSPRLDGTLSHSPCNWMELHQKLFPFVSNLNEASSLLQRAISKLEEPHRTDSVQSVQQFMMDQRTLMRDVLEDSRLVDLQREGGAMLARLKKESDLKYPDCEDLSDALESVTSLYNHVEEQAHVLVQKSNLSLEHLEYLLQVREMEGHFMQLQQWFNVEGEQHLLEAASVEDSGQRMEQILNSFTSFLIEANDRRQHAMTLVSGAEQLLQNRSSYPETEGFWALICNFKSGLEGFFCRAEACGRELQIMVNVCDFCEQATALASECMEYLDQNLSRDHTRKDHDKTLSLGAHGFGPTATNVLLSENEGSTLQTFQDRFLQFSPERFQEMKTQACSLQGSRAMRVWNIAWLKCQEARQQLQERLHDAHEVLHQQSDSSSWCEHLFVDVVSTNVQTLPPDGQNLVVQSTPGPRHPQWESIITGAGDIGKRRPILGTNSTNLKPLACCNTTTKPEESSDAGTSQGSKVTPRSPQRSAIRTEKETKKRQVSRARSERDAAALSQSHTVGCQWFPWGRGLGVRSVSQDSCTTRVVKAESSSPEQQVRSPSSCSHHGQPSCRILQEAQKFQISRHGSFCSEESCMSNRAATGGDETLCYKHSSLPTGRYETVFCSANPQESNALKLQRVLDELVLTEREYVRSLGYILTHYLPLLVKPDIPQDLRGKRGVIFGNLEKLYDFHSHYFLPELEACQMEPAMVARCFLRHGDRFGLYALYSKNKPQSDALILHCRHDIFKMKQQELGDMMDLSSYLLRPIQRISKYSLLLQDMLALAGSYRPKEIIKDPLQSASGCVQSVCGPGVFVPDLTSSEREREKAEIQAAADLVRFQMRHGNDLLTMDAIQECDVRYKQEEWKS